MDPRIQQWAERLGDAEARREPVGPLRDEIGDDPDGRLAYAIQLANVEHAVAQGRRVVGRKIGLTSPAVQRQLGVDQPDFGVLFDDMRCGEDDVVPMGRLLQPKVEAEIAFVLSADLSDGPLDARQVAAAVDYAVAALEIVDSRIAGWDITFGDTVADNASSALFVLGSTQRRLTEFEPRRAEMTMTSDGAVTSTGTGAACLGDPLEALRWLASTARDLGEPLRAGQIILSGALGPMVPVEAGSVVTADITGLGRVSATFGSRVTDTTSQESPDE